GFDIIKSGKAGEMRLLVIMANGFAKQTPLKQYKVQNRGGGGIRTAKITAKTGSIIGSCAVSEETDVFALSKKGQVIRTPLQSVRTTGRDAQGVRIMHVKSGDELAGAVVI
ncbi:MAG: DNA gyrase subunit A, partial [Candidatus Liptonbacteria bacterium]|nr:DNA gyrase subunit A [Candidatus Liptonbacteria bacterium]